METKRAYLPHLYDPIRREIAVRYIRQELRKIFPSLRTDSEWEKIDADVAHWYEGNPTLVPVRDFWNGLYGISVGFKLKGDLLLYLTSKHIKWEQQDVAIGSLWFGKNFEELEHFRAKPSAQEVSEWFFSPENTEILTRVRRAHDTRSNQTGSRDEFPVIAIEREGRLQLVDGDRRLLKKILQEKKSIAACIGKSCGEPVVYEQWVPTPFLLDLVVFHRLTCSNGRTQTRYIAQVIAEMIRDSAAGRFEFSHRCLKQIDDCDKKLWSAVGKILKGRDKELDPIATYR
jgi:hypothetical protein